MKQKRPELLASVFLLLAVFLTACTTEEENELPDGKYPMTFTAAVDGLTATRAAGKDAWTENDPIAVSVDGGTNYKIYKITNTSTGAMTPADPNDIYYWKTNTEELNIQACYPAETVTDKDISDQSQGFASFDYLTAATTARFTASGAIALSFIHQMAKVTYTLQKDNSISDSEFSSATVQIYGYTKATFTEGVLSGTTEGWITPYATDKEALVIPQQMKGQQFIKVTLGADVAAREYFYTPTENKLEAGKQYNYTIIVKKEGLQVTAGTSVSWDDSTENGNATNASFKVHLADFSSSVPSNTSDYKVTDANDGTLTISDGVYSTTSNEINISLSASDGYRLKKFLTKVTSGICKQKVSYTSSSRTYTYTFYDIRSDLWLDGIQAEAESASTSLSNPSVGDYYYADGTWSSTLEKPCIGIVFKVGTAGNDNASNYDSKLSTIHGYVVALHDALTTAGNWGTNGVETPLTNVDNENETAYTGYSDTKTIIDSYSNGNTWKDYQAFNAVVIYRSIVPAPDASSDWYLPSLAQLGDVYSALNSISTPLTTAGQGFTTSASTDNGWYWTSSEKTYSGYDAWHVSFRDGSKASNAKDGTNYNSGKPVCYARAILTF